MSKVVKGKIVNRTEIAAIYGHALTTIDGWVTAGCPVESGGGRGKPKLFNTAKVAAWREAVLREQLTGNLDVNEEQLKRRRMIAETERAELELAKARGEVAPIEQIERASAKVFSEIKVRMLQLPSRLAPQLVGATSNQRNIRRIVKREVEDVLESMSSVDLLEADDLVDDDGDDG